MLGLGLTIQQKQQEAKPLICLYNVGVSLENMKTVGVTRVMIRVTLKIDFETKQIPILY